MGPEGEVYRKIGNCHFRKAILSEQKPAISNRHNPHNPNFCISPENIIFSSNYGILIIKWAGLMLSKLRRRKPIQVVLPSLEELAAAADDEEKITSIIPNAEEQSLVSSPTSTTPIATQLFNRQRIITYIEQIAKAKLLIQNKQNNEARRIFYELKQQYPDYPESYVELGDSFVKDKQADLAVVYYNIAIELAPFDNTTKIKCMLQLQELSKSFEEYIVEPAALNKKLAEAREIKNQEQAYKRWYHSRLRHGLMELNIHSGTPLTDCNAKILDYLDVTLSNGSVLETFQGMQARAHKKYELAEYYFERAIIKHEHDFIAWGTVLSQCLSPILLKVINL
jgi:tetratricopeptide (TPR) repeat protein